MALITCEKLELAYENRVVVSDLSFTVEKGDSICIVGENGAGKTTLMKALLGLLHPKSGRIIYGDGLQRRRIGVFAADHRDVSAICRRRFHEIVLSGCLNQMGFRPFYTRRERRRAGRGFRKAADRAAEKQVLSRAFRRAAAARTAGAGAVRGARASDLGRAGRRAGSGCNHGAVSIDFGLKPGRHDNGYGFARHTKRGSVCK